MTAKRPKKSGASGNGRVTPKGTRPPSKTSTASSALEPKLTVRHAQRDALLNHRAVGDRKPTGARPANRGQR